jgi:hypothetical protein
MALRKSTYSGECIPSSKRFIRDQALPRTVRGPMDFFALRRLEASSAGVGVGDFRSDVAYPAFLQHFSVYHCDTVVKSIMPESEYNMSEG